MATKITSSNHGDSLQGSPEKRLDVAPNGTLWAAIVTHGRPGALKFFRSEDGGSTWSYASGSDISLRQSTAVPSFVIDVDGYAHVSWVTWNNDPQLVMYARGVPSGGGGWSWTTKSISPASGRLGVDSDIVAFRTGNGWTVWISWNNHSGGKTSRLRISQNGSISIEATSTAPSGSSGYQPGALEFQHIGDGRTASSSPNLLYAQFSQGSSGPIRLSRSLYSSGSWTWEKPVVVESSINIQKTTLTQAYDGERLVVAYAGSGSSTIKVVEWVPGSTTTTTRNPPAAPSGTGAVLGISISIDPQTDDVYLAYYDAQDGDIRYSKLTRSNNTWSAWSVAISKNPSSDKEDGKVQLVRHPPRDSVDMIYGNGNGSSWTIYSQQLVALIRSPLAPTLIYPASGAQVNLANGCTFRWAYNPVSPGDGQQGWYFRRQASGGAVEYWNAGSQSWVGSAVLNVGSAENAVFASGKWTSGTTYTWSVRTRSSTGSDSPWAPDRIVVATSAPVVTVTAPQGIVYGESTPLVEWSYTGIDAQRSYEVAIFSDAQAAVANFDPATSSATWRSGVVTSSIARSARIEVALSDSVGYRAYVRATSTIGVDSGWAYSSFVISISPPVGPVVELREQIKYETDCPRVRLDIVARSNFLSQDQALGQTGWIAGDNVGSMTAQEDDSANQLVQSLRVTSAAAGLVSVMTDAGTPPAAPYGQPQPTGPLHWPVVPGDAYTGLASIKAPGAARAARVVICWYDADDGTGSLIEETIGGQIVVGTTEGQVSMVGWGDSWAEAWAGQMSQEGGQSGTAYSQAYVTGIAPPTAKLARIRVEILGATAADELFYVTQISFAPGRSLTWASGGYSTTQTVRVERSADGGQTWEVAIDRAKTDLYQRTTAFDRLMPYQTDVKYRASTMVDIGMSAIASEWSLVSTIRIESDLWAIRDPNDDIGEMNAYVIGIQETDDESSSVHRPAGRLYPVVDTEGLRASTGYVTIFVKYRELETAKFVTQRTVPLVLQSPSGRILRVRITQRDYDVESNRHHRVRLKFAEVDTI